MKLDWDPCLKKLREIEVTAYLPLIKVNNPIFMLSGYVSDKRYLGALVGRVANRIAKGHFVVEGKEFQLDTNNGPNALHGGLRGFNKVR